ncbi:uncharacterized protein HaLaN_29581, partial [Haematococcus lacustris]
NAQLVQQKRSTFMAREAEAAVRRKELEEIRLRQEEQKRQEELRRERDRHDKYMSAVEMEAQRRASIKARAEEKERMLSELYEKRRKENDLKRVEQDFQLKLRLDKVDAMQKTSLYQRQELLAKILQEYEKTRSLMRDRTELQRQRKMTNMQSSMQRQAISQVMDALKSSKGMKVLAQGGGQININQLLGSVNHELSRKELAERQQRKVEELERRNQELQRQRLEQEAARSAKQREIELLKVT